MPNRTLISLCLFASLFALALSTYAILTRPSEKQIADRVYGQLLTEAWVEVEPVFEDFGIDQEKPNTFRELLKPLLGVENPLATATQPSAQTVNDR